MRKRLSAGAVRAGILIAVFATALFAAAPDSPVADAAQAGDLATVRALLQSGADVNAAQGDGMTALHWAAVQGAAEMADVLLYAGANSEATTRLGGFTPLHLAARYGQAELVRRLLAGGSDAQARTGTGVTPLHFAAGAGLATAVQDLIAAGADVDATEWANGQTPLMFASAGDRIETVEVLLAAGADFSTTSAVIDYAARAESDGAARRRRQELVTAIRKAEAEARGETEADEEQVATRTETPPGQDPTPQEEAARRAAEPAAAATPTPGAAAQRGEAARRAEATEGEVAEEARVSEEEASQEEAADEAEGTDTEESEGEESEDVELAADPRRGAEEAATAEPPQGDEPPEGETAHAEEADEDEADPGEPDEDEAAGETPDEEDAAAPTVPAPQPLSYAQIVGRQGGMSPLHYAIRDGNADIVRALLAAGADIDRPTDGDRSTPLVLASINGHYDLALWLLGQGADPRLASEDGVTPLYAVIANRWAPKALYPQPTAFKQQEASYLDLMDALLRAGADPNARVETHIWYASFNFDLLGVNFMGATPFWRAAHALDVPAMELLVAHGANPHTPTMKPPERRFGRRGSDEEDDPSGLPPAEVGGPGIPPIVAAAGVGYGRDRTGNSHRHAPDSWLAAARYLVEVVGADLNARDHDGFGALHYAAARGDNELIRYLVEHGADPLIVARSGQTTVDMANGPIQRVQPFFETIALLESMGAKNNNNCVSC